MSERICLEQCPFIVSFGCEKQIYIDPKTNTVEYFCEEHLWCERCGSKRELSEMSINDGDSFTYYSTGKCYNSACAWYRQ